MVGPVSEPRRWFRIYGEGPMSGPRTPLLDGWRQACVEQERALERGDWARHTLAAVARVACEQAMLNQRRN